MNKSELRKIAEKFSKINIIELRADISNRGYLACADIVALAQYADKKLNK